LSGLSTRRFCFEGFLPADKKERKAVLEDLKEESRTMILYEAPHHLKGTLKELWETVGNRKITLCRELTKKFETIFPTTLEDALEYYNKAVEFSENKEIEYTLIGTIYYNEENLDKAIEYFNMAIDINDNYDPAYEGKNQSMLENHLKILDLQDNLIKQNLF